MSITGVQEQLRTLDCVDEGASGLDVTLGHEGLVSVHTVDLHRNALRPADPNSETGRQASNSRAPAAPGLVWASSCAGITPREKPA